MALSMNSVGIPGRFRGNAGSRKFGVWGGFGILGAALGVRNSTLGIRNYILGMASHEGIRKPQFSEQLPERFSELLEEGIPHPQDKIQHLDLTKAPRPLYYKTLQCILPQKCP